MLIGQFWGTSAAEGIPAPFCRCAVCEEARANPALRRTRTCFRLSEKVMIDPGADAVCQSMQYGDLQELEHVLITHTHEDHLNPHMLMEAFWCHDQRKGPLHYYFTDQAYDMVRHWLENDWILKGMVPGWIEKGHIVFHKLEYGERYEIDGMFVTPLRGNHTGNVKENSALYFLELPDGRSLFYGLDSGPYFTETLEALRGKHIDIMVNEGTFGKEVVPHNQHMDIYAVRSLIDQLWAQGTLDEQSVLYITHISHRISQSEMESVVAELKFPLPTTVCLDGDKIL